MHYICTRHTNSIYVSKFQVNTVTIIEVIRQNVFSYARVMVIGVSSDLNKFVLSRGSIPLSLGFFRLKI